MVVFRLLAKCFAQPCRRNSAGRSRAAWRLSARLSVTALEDRLAPAVLTVNSLLDGPISAASSTLSLREAVALIDSGGTATDASGTSLAAAKAGQLDTTNPFGVNDVIQFAPSLFGSGQQQITLQDGTLSLDRDVTINGPAASLLAVSGNNQGTVLEIAPGATVSISGLTVEAGAAGAGAGGGINNSGTLTLSNSTVSGNTAAQGSGGGINNSGTLTLANSTVSGNAALSNGGLASSGTLTLIDSTVSGNTAAQGNGGLANYGGAMTLIDSTVSGNTALGAGGLGNYEGGTATLIDSTVSGNSAGGAAGGLVNFATLTLTDSTVSGNTAGAWGGGVYNLGTMTLANSTVSGNAAALGGGIDNMGTMTLANSTVTGNTAAQNNGGIDNDGGTLTLVDSTVTGNTAGVSGGPGNSNGGTLTLVDSTVSGDTAVKAGPDNGGMPTNSTVLGNRIATDNTGTQAPTNVTALANTQDSSTSIETGTRSPSDRTTADDLAANNASIFNTAAWAVFGHLFGSVPLEGTSGTSDVATLTESTQLASSIDDGASTAATPLNEGFSTGLAGMRDDSAEAATPAPFDFTLAGDSAGGGDSGATATDQTSADTPANTAAPTLADGPAEEAPPFGTEPEMHAAGTALAGFSGPQSETDGAARVVLLDRDSGFRAEWTPGYLTALLLPWFTTWNRPLKEQSAQPLESLKRKEDRP